MVFHNSRCFGIMKKVDFCSLLAQNFSSKVDYSVFGDVKGHNSFLEFAIGTEMKLFIINMIVIIESYVFAPLCYLYLAFDHKYHLLVTPNGTIGCE